jgi:hypothetical protein
MSIHVIIAMEKFDLESLQSVLAHLSPILCLPLQIAAVEELCRLPLPGHIGKVPGTRRSSSHV